MDGSTVRVVVDGEITEGSEFTLFDVDTVSGLDDFTLLFDDESQWDLSRLGEGKIRLGPGVACDPSRQGDVVMDKLRLQTFWFCLTRLETLSVSVQTPTLIVAAKSPS